MILRIPQYCEKFRCIADKCRDSCCIGWEIDIDEKTASFYDSVGGDFGKRLRSNITTGETRCFRLDSSERCPFLNEHNLCDIYINLGEENLCQICTDHPRYYEWFDGVKEGGVGLCCEAAAVLILSEEFSLVEKEIPTESADEYDKEFYSCLYSARESIISHLMNKDYPLSQALCDILLYAEALQYNVDNGDLAKMNITHTGKSLSYDIKAILSFLQTLEIMDETWMPYVKTLSESYDRIAPEMKNFRMQNPEVSKYLRNIAVYFVWRYFMKGVFDGEFVSRIKLMTVSCFVLEYLFCYEWVCDGSAGLEAYAEAARRYSKEIEYCEENLNTLYDAFYELEIFGTQNVTE
ncbi:MAG: flagellin lysine-N-methylase [Oscillospiraceae bacterium]|nr:flagellin lysine-N-methylase [Oscillospiraceae bacterium]